MSHTVSAGVIMVSARDTFSWPVAGNLFGNSEIQCEVFCIITTNTEHKCSRYQLFYDLELLL